VRPASIVLSDADTAIEAAQAETRAPEEVKFEDVWRPRRRHDGERPDRRRRRGHQEGHQQRESRPNRPHQRDRQQQQQQHPAAAVAGPGGEQRHRQSAGGGQKFRDRANEGRRDGRRGDERRKHQERQQAPMQMRSSPPKRAEVDPDSPFAALSALKKALEKQAQESGTS
jgi:ATP-dependent RNA helicase SUPV3L1/SUV3